MRLLNILLKEKEGSLLRYAATGLVFKLIALDESTKNIRIMVLLQN